MKQEQKKQIHQKKESKVITIECTPNYATHYAEGVKFTIKELHDMNMARLSAQRAEAARRACVQEHANVSLLMLQLSLGLAALAVHAAKLEMAAESETFARKFWTNVSIN